MDRGARAGSSAARPQRRAGIVVALAVLGSLAALAAGAAWWGLAPGPRPSQLRVRFTPPGAPCSSVDLELKLAEKVAVVRDWEPAGDGSNLCRATARRSELTPEQLKRARSAAGTVGQGGIVRTLVLGEKRPGTVKLEIAHEGALHEETSERSFTGAVPPGMVDLEALYAELVAAAPSSPQAAPAANAPPSPMNVDRAAAQAWPIPTADPRRVDLRDILASLEGHASRGLSGPGLASMTLIVERGGDVDLTSQVILADYQSRNVRLSYRIERGLVRTGPPMDRTERSPPAPSACSSRDLWRRAIAAGMQDAAQVRLTLVSAPRPGGGVGTVWAFQPLQGPWDHRLRFDATTCAHAPG